ncbi:neuromedin-K receptor-like [Actinia tenebrosa]|uniref:Neuromedin-K receptor-like n=1 Tax=Actinia tenebrosa TaxID=6105 RepID=A0A6P8ILP7_ACTTE|nr:neuromedin-K receptor-like [Actinia tenebrosa]
MNVTSNYLCFTHSLRNTTGTLHPKSWITSQEVSRIAFTVCYSILLFLAVVGNVFVVVIVCKNRRMQTNINFLIANMAVSDLTGSLVSIPRFISLNINNSSEWSVPGLLAEILCKTCPFIRDVSISVSIESMVVIAIDRFFAVVYPLKSKPRVTRLRWVLPIIWLVAMAPFSLYFVTFKIGYCKGKAFCIFSWPSIFDRAQVHHIYFLVTIVILFFIIPFAIVSVLHSFIVWKMKHRCIPGEQLCEQETRSQKSNSNIIKMAIVIVLSFFVCWFPYHTLTFFEVFVWKGYQKKSAPSFHSFTSDILTFISYISLAINPLICFVFSSNYRNCLKKLFPFSLFLFNKASAINVKTQRTAATHSQEMTNCNR